jgi:hypothetical protein
MENSTKLIRGLIIMKGIPKIPPKTKSTHIYKGKGEKGDPKNVMNN